MLLHVIWLKTIWPDIWLQTVCVVRDFDMIVTWTNPIRFAESQQPPQFTTEIVDARVQEGESATFECYFAGNPKPGKKKNTSK